MDVRKAVFAVVGVVGVGVAGWMATAAHRANEQRFHALEREMKTVTTEARNSASLVRRDAATPSKPLAPRAALALESAVLDAPAPEAPENGSDPSVDAASDIASEEEYYFKVGAAFSAETKDAAWARETEYALNQALSKIVETSTVDALECRQSLCRAKLRHTDQEKYSAFIDRTAASANETWTGEVTWYRESVSDGGAVESTLYFGKPGVSIHELALAQ